MDIPRSKTLPAAALALGLAVTSAASGNPNAIDLHIYTPVRLMDYSTSVDADLCIGYGAENTVAKVFTCSDPWFGIGYLQLRTSIYEDVQMLKVAGIESGSWGYTLCLGAGASNSEDPSPVVWTDCENNNVLHFRRVRNYLWADGRDPYDSPVRGCLRAGYFSGARLSLYESACGLVDNAGAARPEKATRWQLGDNRTIVLDGQSRPLHMYTFEYRIGIDCRTATVQNGVFADVDSGDFDTVLNYQTWNGTPWSAKIDPISGKFLHSQGGFTGGSWHDDVILNYVDCAGGNRQLRIRAAL